MNQEFHLHSSIPQILSPLPLAISHFWGGPLRVGLSAISLLAFCFLPRSKNPVVCCPVSVGLKCSQRMPLQSLTQRVKKRSVPFYNTAPVETSPLWRLIKKTKSISQRLSLSQSQSSEFRVKNKKAMKKISIAFVFLSYK